MATSHSTNELVWIIHVGIDRALIGSFTPPRLPMPLSQGAWAAASIVIRFPAMTTKQDRIANPAQ